MIEPKFPMHEGLDRFEQDLKSLTPKQYSEAISVQAKVSTNELELCAQPDAVPSADNQPYRSPTANRTWIQIAKVSWVTGLAAGILLSAIWTKVMIKPVPLAKSNAITENVAATESNLPKAKSILASQPSAWDEQDSLEAIYRSIATDSAKDVVLRPIVQRNAFFVNPTSLPSTTRIDQVESGSHLKTKQPDVNGHNTMPSPASEFNSLQKHPSQRQLLKILMEFDNLKTI